MRGVSGQEESLGKRTGHESLGMRKSRLPGVVNAKHKIKESGDGSHETYWELPLEEGDFGGRRQPERILQRNLCALQTHLPLLGLKITNVSSVWWPTPIILHSTGGGRLPTGLQREISVSKQETK